jgi:protein tyrosine/serine phosphatase
MAPSTPPSWIDLDGAVNTRDVGGLPTTDGGRTAYRRLLRSDNLQNLSAADVRRLATDLGVRTVVDLRTAAEVEAEGPGPLAGVEGVSVTHHSVIPEGGLRTDATADVTADALVSRRDRALARYPDDPVVAYYLGYLEDRPDSVAGALRSIATSPGAALVNCAAGKDRTGVVVALALAVAGVQSDAIVADYVASGDRIDAILDRLRSSPTYSGDIDRLPADAHRPRSESMTAWLAEVERLYGGAEAWVRSAGFNDDDVASLRRHLRDTGR